MKKLFYLSAIITIAGMLFTSCSKQTSLTLTKRLYRKGYYIDFGIAENSKHSTKAGKTDPMTKLNPVAAAPVELASNVSVENLQMISETRSETPEVVTESQSVKPTKVAKLINKAKNANTNLINKVNAFEAVKHNTASENAQKGSTDKLHGGEDILILLFCIFIPPIGVFLLRGLGIEFWLDLLLTILFFIPGMIYAIIVFLE